MEFKKVRWWIYGAFGALLLGSGVSIAIESGFLKHSQAQWYLWVAMGTLGLALIISGVVFLIKAGVLEKEFKKKH